MPDRASFRVLVATDGSRPARAAVAAAVSFPWPKRASGHGVLARARLPGRGWRRSVTTAIEQSELRAALAARRSLRRRWSDAAVSVVARAPVEGILAEARRLGVDAIVLGSRGHGPWTRLVLGSVSLGVVRRSPTPVLVVKRSLRGGQHLLIGLDGSVHARRAVEFVSGLDVPDGGAVTLATVLESLRPVSMRLLPASVRGAIGDQLAAFEAERRQAAQRAIDGAARRLKRAGWAVEVQVRLGIPLVELLAATRAVHADVLVLGARGVGGLERLLLGSVAEGALSRSPVSVLVVR
jgi:nucleotide-binding universal stress UspA family protein